MTKKPVVNIFWTGGWDSTFRLIQLLLFYKRKVQPHYIIDPDRKSIHYELITIEKIKSLLCGKYPQIAGLLLPLKTEFVPNLKSNFIIEESYKKLSKKFKLGVQYLWLSKYCFQNNITDMELCHEAFRFSEESVAKNVFGPVLKVIDEDDYYFKLDNEFKESDAFKFFGNFKLVLFETTKLEMQEFSKRNGFFDILKETWFCHLPRNNGLPCGKCPPCIATYHEGLTWRLPFFAKMRYHLWPTLRKIAVILRLTSNSL